MVAIILERSLSFLSNQGFVQYCCEEFDFLRNIADFKLNTQHIGRGDSLYYSSACGSILLESDAKLLLGMG